MGGFFAFANLGANLGPLLVGASMAGAVTLGVGGRPKGEDVHAAIGVFRGDVDGPHDFACAPMPGEPEFSRALLDSGDDLVGDVPVDVEALGRHGGSPCFAGRAIAASWGQGYRPHQTSDQTPRLRARRLAGRSCTNAERKRAALIARRGRSTSPDERARCGPQAGNPRMKAAETKTLKGRFRCG
jgi:hypothetical protein